MPKADINCRLDGSVSLKLLWEELKTAEVDIKKRFGIKANNLDELETILFPGRGADTLSLGVAKDLFNCVLQTSQQLERAVDDIVEKAKIDNVQCMCRKRERENTHHTHTHR